MESHVRPFKAQSGVAIHSKHPNQRMEGIPRVMKGESDITSPAHSTASSTQPNNELSELLSLVGAKQDKAAFTQLFRFFAPKIKRFGIKQFGNETQANELVQETMTNVWKKAGLYDANKGAATTWVYTVMRNASFDQLRKQQARAEQNLGDDIWPIEQAVEDRQENGIESLTFTDHLMSKQLAKLVDSLPVAQKVVVQGVYFQELSQEQLAKQLGIPIGTIKSRLRLALKKIREQMGEQDND